MKTKLLAAAMFLATAGTANAADLIVNGSFEADPVSGSYQVYTAPTSFTGWSVTDGSIDLVKVPPYIAYDGSQALDLVGTGTSTGSIAQDVVLTAGQAYRLTFAYSNNTDNPGQNYSGRVGVSGAGTFAGSYSHTGGTSAAPNWTIFDGTFTASSSGNATLTFADTSGHGNQGIFLDSVSLVAVPEPATWAMMIGGVGMVGGAMRRRRTAGSLATA